MRFFARLLLVTALIVFGTEIMPAQVTTGTPPFGPDFDTLNWPTLRF